MARAGESCRMTIRLVGGATLRLRGTRKQLQWVKWVLEEGGPENFGAEPPKWTAPDIAAHGVQVLVRRDEVQKISPIHE